MDLSGLFLFVIAALVSAGVVIATRRSARRPSQLVVFVVILVAALVLMRPWEALYPGEWPEGTVMILLLAAWIGTGTLSGAAFARRTIDRESDR